jgi:peroxiredoxin
MSLMPLKPVPALELRLAGGGSWSLKGGSPPASFTMVVFYRGLHCPICKRMLQELQTRLFEFEERGVKVVAVSADTEERAMAAKKDWGLDKLAIAYGLTMPQAREWGLFVSSHIGTTSIGIEEPRVFNEPGLFLVRPDGTLYYSSIQSGPYGRPNWSELVGILDFIKSRNYPARGDVAA